MNWKEIDNIVDTDNDDYNDNDGGDNDDNESKQKSFPVNIRNSGLRHRAYK